MKGIDVSVWNGEVDFKIKEDVAGEKGDDSK